MDYHFECLSDDRFQTLCQAVLATVFPNVQCYPVNQPDGGRDGALNSNRRVPQKDFVVFQVKFSRTPALREDRESVISLIKSELPKIERLKSAGASAYYLITNIQGTSHFDVGSIDRADSELSAITGIDTYCWWRNDLERRIDGNGSIKWSYPEILRGLDVLQIILESGNIITLRARHNTLRTYLAGQYFHDEKVKFKQVQLQNRLLDLIVDVPVRPSNPEETHLLALLGLSRSNAPFSHLSERVSTKQCAAYVLLQASTVRAAPLIVLEGAPGQGKSTITQYLSQIHRMHILGKSNDLDSIPVEHASSQLRFPLRVDLRDVAIWLSGKSPFASSLHEPLPPGTPRSLEGFLARHIHENSGGAEFEISDLSALLTENHIFIVLDGFDEVAEIDARDRLVKEVSISATRMTEIAKSLQMIVTSRPAAFANSPGFPAKDWPHLELQALSKAQIETYAEKWMTAKNLTKVERIEFNSALAGHLEQAHIRDLSRNPMQLSILLALVHAKGLSLPEKRTALYDSYLDLFFGREAEKSEVFREHRDLLIWLHRYLAWLLQCEAEEGKGTGSIEESRLKDVLSKYLHRHGHDNHLVNKLFQGMVERVGALVSRVQGTFEFEVQPLREYFAAKYLYETAPYSPVGTEKRGTKPEIFSAISANTYWLNVTRFYAGCYSCGELSSLVDGIYALGKHSAHRETAYSRQLSVLLLGDWVFSQEPFSVERIVSYVIHEPELKIYLASRAGRSGISTLSLPTKAGRIQFIELLKPFLKVGTGSVDYDEHIASTLRFNLESSESIELAWELAARAGYGLRWARLCGCLGVAGEIAEKLLSRPDSALNMQAIHSLCQVDDRIDLIISDPKLFSYAVGALLAGGGPRINLDSRDNFPPAAQAITALSQATNVYFYLELFRSESNTILRDIADQYYYKIAEGAQMAQSDELDTSLLSKMCETKRAFGILAETPAQELKQSLQPITDFLEAARGELGESQVLRELACAIAGIPSFADRGSCPRGLGDPLVPLMERARFARLRSGDPKWWINQLCAEQGRDLGFALLLLFSWATPRTLAATFEALATHVDTMQEQEWETLANAVEYIGEIARDFRRDPKEYVPALGTSLTSDRIMALLMLRLGIKGRRIFLERGCCGYRGIDKVVLGIFSKHAISSLLKPNKGDPDYLPLVEHSYKITEIDAPISFYRHPKSMLDERVASRILKEPRKYPMVLLSAAEYTLRTLRARAVPKVGKTARAEHWAALD